MIQAAKRYYELNMTIGELAEELGLTRWQARRLLNEARECGHRAHRDRAEDARAVPTSKAACNARSA